jgi:tetratricopeptide (TPR) repeat protein
MGFFSKRFGRKPEPAKEKAAPPAAPLDPAKNKDLVRVYDAYGREMYMTRETWRDNVLVGSLKKEWDNPDKLFGLVLSGLNDGFRSVVIEATEHLYKIDHDRPRATCLWGIVLKDENRLDEAEKVFRDFLAEHGENGSVLTNLAKVYAKRNNDLKADEILWRALEVDPNQDNGLAWYRVIQRERRGSEAEHEALERVAILPGSWRAQLWLARTSLESKNLDRALVWYREALDHAAKPVPADLLMQMSGDLGKHGYLVEAMKLTEPLFDAKVHGLAVGNNILKAHFDLGQLDDAREILDRLYACKRPDWHRTLGFWDTEIAKARVATVPAESAETPRVSMVNIVNPIWLPASSPAVELFPNKAQDEFVICFLGSSAELPDAGQKPQHQMADRRGRLSRALPLFLAEQVYFGTRARVQSLIPWLTGATSAFVFAGKAWPDERASTFAKQATPAGDFIVVTHLLTQSEPWTVQARLLRPSDGKCLASLEATISSEAPGEKLLELSNRVLAVLSENVGLQTNTFPPFYRLPASSKLSNYLLRLEQLVAIRCATIDGVPDRFLNGEREIIDGNIQLCLANPDNAVTRILMAQTINAMRRVRPDIVPEFANKWGLLQKEKPLSEPMQTVIKRILEDEPGKNKTEP